MRFTHGPAAIALATVVAFAGTTIMAAPVAATDPTPTASTEGAVSTPQPADPSPDIAAPDPSVDPALAADDPAADPAISPDPAAVATEAPLPALPDAPPESTAPTSPVITPSVVTTAHVAAPVHRPVAKPSVGARVVRIALAQRHRRYVRGATGPRAFDCSGLVRYAYRMAGVSRHLGGGHSARAMYLWARRHHLTSRSHPRVGDVVIYGGGTHAAIYIGHGRVISALNPRQGIRVTSLHALGARFTAFIHTHI